MSKKWTLTDLIEAMKTWEDTWDLESFNIDREPQVLDPMLGQCPYDGLTHFAAGDEIMVTMTLRAKKSAIPEPKALAEVFGRPSGMDPSFLREARD